MRERRFLLWQRGKKGKTEQRRAHAPKPQETIPQSHPSATDAFSISGVLIPWSSSSTICSRAVQKSCLASVIQLLLQHVSPAHTHTHTCTETYICAHVNTEKQIERERERGELDNPWLERALSQWEDSSVWLLPGESYEGAAAQTSRSAERGNAGRKMICREAGGEGTAGLTTISCYSQRVGLPWQDTLALLKSHFRKWITMLFDHLAGTRALSWNVLFSANSYKNTRRPKRVHVLNTKTALQEQYRGIFNFNSWIPFQLLEVMNARSLTPVGLKKTLHECYRPWCNLRAQSSAEQSSCFNSPAEGVKCSCLHVSPVGRDSVMLWYQKWHVLNFWASSALEWSELNTAKSFRARQQLNSLSNKTNTAVFRAYLLSGGGILSAAVMSSDWLWCSCFHWVNSVQI